MTYNRRAFSAIEVIIVIVIIAVLGIIAFVMTKGSSSSANLGSNVSWQRNGSGWKASGKAPACPSPLSLTAPVDISKVTAILYPGQTRGGNYKPHGGFLFADSNNSDITVTAPMDGAIVRGVRYMEAGEVQYMFDLTNDCGIMHRFDHLLTLSSQMQKIAETLPPATESSQTTNIANQTIRKGDIIATAVGHTRPKNVSMDWGVYDLRAKNNASKNTTWAAAHDPELAHYALCWLNDLTSPDKEMVKSLPGGDQKAGKTSDFCK